MNVRTRQRTAEELLRLPDDGFRYELVEGEIRQMTPTGGQHGAVVMNLSVPLARHVKKEGLGVVFGAETGFRIGVDPDTVRAPDIAFASRNRLPESGVPAGFLEGPPDLAVEVISPGDAIYDVEERVERWLAAGAGAVWVVNPRRRTVVVHTAEGIRTLCEDDVLDGGDVVRGFRCPIRELFD
jgi:Uma2 family endonuclease